MAAEMLTCSVYAQAGVRQSKLWGAADGIGQGNHEANGSIHPKDRHAHPVRVTGVKEDPTMNLVSPNFDARPVGGAVDMLVLHYTGMRSCAEALARLCDPAAKVSAHYLLDEDGSLYSLVAEDCRAWHAGVSFWRGHTDINARSIGIELVNPGHEFGYRPFPEVQMVALIDLCRGILARHPIPPRNVVGHADVAPRRKRDPGELFDWRQLAAAGIGMWPEGTAGGVDDLAVSLAAIGYETVDLPATVAAFRDRFGDGGGGFGGACSRSGCRAGVTGQSPWWLDRAGQSITLGDARRPGGRLRDPETARGRKVRAPREHGAG